MERLMFWCSEDQMRIFQEAFEKDKRLSTLSQLRLLLQRVKEYLGFPGTL